MYHHAFWEEKPTPSTTLISKSLCVNVTWVLLSIVGQKHIAKIVKKAEGVLASLTKSFVDLAPSDYHLFPNMKKPLARNYYRGDYDIISAADDYFLTKLTNGIQAL
ncbi:Hypothetical predicted protein [Octopus vulgaris]|uniref:Uncharacterized protein n=1 Tax=Octopus vulgaris TaxID=6645 RepID=A0AA36EXZ5_OCTVU|nr:Hypothetical predicted protein [Octopus vulgaris]